MHWLFKFLSKHSLHSDEIQKCWLICERSFKASSRAHNMDNRFPPAEREAWIILFIVNTGEAWNHTQRSMQELLFQLQPRYVHGGLSFPQHSLWFFPPKTCFPPSTAIIETKLLIILICRLFVYWWSDPNSDWSHLTDFPLCNSHLHHDGVWKGFEDIRLSCLSQKSWFASTFIYKRHLSDLHFRLGIVKTVVSQSSKLIH